MRNHLIDVIVPHAVLVLKSLVQTHLQQNSSPFSQMSQKNSSYSSFGIISRLAYKIDEISHPKARACVIWLVGQYAFNDVVPQNGADSTVPEGVNDWAPDVLRKSARTFAREVCPFLCVYPSD